MAGKAGQDIGISSTQPAIAQAVALVQAGTSGRGCTTNFIGFGKDTTSEEPLPADFDAVDDEVAICATGAALYIPVYAPVVGAIPPAATLTWEEPTPP
jgi:hypothetical protein